MLEDGAKRADVLLGLARIGIVLLVATLLLALARRALPRLVRRLADVARHDERWEQRTQTLSGTLSGVVGVVVWTLVLVTVLGELGVNLGPLLAGAGVVGLAVGFGAQQLVRDVISGFFVLVEDQYGVGDRVTLGGVTGTVEGLSLRLTRVRGEDGVLHHVRNGDVGVVSNASRGYAVATVTVPVAGGRDVQAAADRVRAAMASIVADGSVDGLLLADPQVLGVTDLRGDSGTPVLTVTARTTPEGRSAVQRQVLQAAAAAVAEPDAPAPRARRR